MFPRFPLLLSGVLVFLLGTPLLAQNAQERPPANASQTPRVQSADSILDRILRGDPARVEQQRAVREAEARRRENQLPRPEDIIRQEPEMIQQEERVQQLLPEAFALNMADLEDYLRDFFPTRPLLVHMVFPRSSRISLRTITRGSAVAQAVALRTPDRPVHVSTGGSLRRRHFNVLIGTRDELANEIRPELASRIRGSFIGLQPQWSDEDTFTLVISGLVDADVDEAILSMGLVQRNLPASPFLSIERVLLPERPAFFRQPPLQPRDILTFDQLEDLGAPVFLSPDGGILLGINLPPDALLRGLSSLRLRLHFSLGQQVIRTSNALEVAVNGKVVNRVPWTDSTSTDLGTRVMHFNVPANAFLPGQNLLLLRPEQRAPSEFALGARVEINPEFTIFNDSIIEIPSLSRGAWLPDLFLATRTFFPHIGQPDGSELSVVLQDRETITVETAWTLMAKLAQQSNAFMYAADFNFQLEPTNRHVLMVGSYGNLPVSIRERVSNQSFTETGRNVLDLSTRIQRDLPWHERWIDRFRAEFVVLRNGQARVRERSNVAEILQESITMELGPRAVMTTFHRDENPSYWVLLVTARSPELLNERVRQVVLDDFWSSIRGVSFSWINAVASVAVTEPEARFMELSLSEIVALPFGYFGVSLRAFYIIAALVFVLFLILTMIVLRKTEKIIMDRNG